MTTGIVDNIREAVEAMKREGRSPEYVEAALAEMETAHNLALASKFFGVTIVVAGVHAAAGERLGQRERRRQ